MPLWKYIYLPFSWDLHKKTDTTVMSMRLLWYSRHLASADRCTLFLFYGEINKQPDGCSFLYNKCENLIRPNSSADCSKSCCLSFKEAHYSSVLFHHKLPPEIKDLIKKFQLLPIRLLIVKLLGAFLVCNIVFSCFGVWNNPACSIVYAFIGACFVTFITYSIN